jgi:hypothetical protein
MVECQSGHIVHIELSCAQPCTCGPHLHLRRRKGPISDFPRESAIRWERQRDTDFPGAPAPGPAARAGAAAHAGKTPPKKVIWTGFSPLPCVPSYSNPTSPPHALLGSIPRLDSPASHRFAPRTHAPPATPPPEPRLAFAFAPDRQHGISSICRGRASPCKAVGLGGRRQRLRLGQRLSQLQLERGLLPGQLHLQPLAAHLRG